MTAWRSTNERARPSTGAAGTDERRCVATVDHRARFRDTARATARRRYSAVKQRLDSREFDFPRSLRDSRSAPGESPGFGDQVGFDEFFVQVDAETGTIGNVDPAIDGLNFFVSQFMTEWRIFHAVFEQEGIAAGA